MPTARAISFSGPGQVVLIERDLGPPGTGQLLVRSTRSLISAGTEGIVLHRRYAPGTHWERYGRFPFQPGYSLVGVVEAVGPDLSGFRIGDRVAARGPHASMALVDGGSAVRIPDGVGCDQATWMALGKIAQIGVRAAEHRLGDAVAVVGCGPLGQLVVQYARLCGAREVIAIDAIPARLELASLLGATATIVGTAEAARSGLLERLAPDNGAPGADVVYDVTGHHAAFAQCLPLARWGGTVVVLGDTGHPRQQTLTPDLITRGLRIVGAHDNHAPRHLPPGMPGWTAGMMMALVLSYLERGQLRVDELITHRFAPEQAAEAYRALDAERDRALGVLFTW